MKQGVSIKSFNEKILRSKLISAQKFLKEKKYTEALAILEKLISPKSPISLVYMLRGDAMTGLIVAVLMGMVSYGIAAWFMNINKKD